MRFLDHFSRHHEIRNTGMDAALYRFPVKLQIFEPIAESADFYLAILGNGDKKHWIHQ